MPKTVKTLIKNTSLLRETRSSKVCNYLHLHLLLCVQTFLGAKLEANILETKRKVRRFHSGPVIRCENTNSGVVVAKYAG